MRGTPVLGVLSVAGQWGRDMRPPLWPGEVAALGGLPPLPLMVDHLAVIRPSGIVDIGRTLEYRYADDPPRVTALLDVYDQAVAAAVERGQLGGLSLGRACSEVSLTANPAYRGCRVLCWGPDALARWQHQAGHRAARGSVSSPPQDGLRRGARLMPAAVAEVR